ncbi:MAG: hypothetical protein PHY54_01960 [Methylococcales bacterium]|nr:hypothetical protein [Methylococcales bacterium]
MKNIAFRNIRNAFFLAVFMQISGCAGNVREESADTVAERVKHVSTANKQGLAWLAPYLHLSHYRTLFYGYDTVDYRLAAPETTANGGFRLLIDASYGGNLRHYDLARFPDLSTRVISHRQHDVERCQLFNYMISSCLYRDLFSLDLSRSDLENARTSGLQILLSSGKQDYERINLPANYIQGFLKASSTSKAKQIH